VEVGLDQLALVVALGLVLARGVRLGLLALRVRRRLDRLAHPPVELGLILPRLLQLLLELLDRELQRHPVGPVAGLQRLALGGELGLRLGLGNREAALLLAANPCYDLEELLVGNPLTTPGTRVLLLLLLLRRRECHLPLQEKKGPGRTL